MTSLGSSWSAPPRHVPTTTIEISSADSADVKIRDIYIEVVLPLHVFLVKFSVAHNLKKFKYK